MTAIENGLIEQGRLRIVQPDPANLYLRFKCGHFLRMTSEIALYWLGEAHKRECPSCRYKHHA